MLKQNKLTITVLFQRQVKRYKQKGLLNIFIALSLLVVIIIGGTHIGKQIWPEEIQNIFLFTIKTSFCIHFACQLFFFLLYLPGYMGADSYKPFQVNKGSVKPWHRPNWKSQLLRTVGSLLINKSIIYPALLYVSMSISGTKIRLTEFPQPLEVFIQIIIIMFLDDFFFYCVHKLSHQYKFLYQFHKIHHQYDNVFSLVAQYSHPVDYLCGILIPSVLPFLILGSKVHFFMIFFWQIWKIYLSAEGHSGYQVQWSPSRVLPLVSGASYHDFHHSTNVGNYSGSIYLWDTIFHDNDEYFNMLQKEKQQEKC